MSVIFTYMYAVLCQKHVNSLPDLSTSLLFFLFFVSFPFLNYQFNHLFSWTHAYLMEVTWLWGRTLLIAALCCRLGGMGAAKGSRSALYRRCWYSRPPNLIQGTSQLFLQTSGANSSNSDSDPKGQRRCRADDASGWNTDERTALFTHIVSARQEQKHCACANTCRLTHWNTRCKSTHSH